VCLGKWARGGWAGSDEQELLIKEETQVGGWVDLLGTGGSGRQQGWVVHIPIAP